MVQVNAFKPTFPPMAYAAVRSNAVILLLLNHCLLLRAPIVCGGSVFVPCYFSTFFFPSLPSSPSS